jgi:hypothetical protein
VGSVLAGQSKEDGHVIVVAVPGLVISNTAQETSPLDVGLEKANVTLPVKLPVLKYAPSFMLRVNVPVVPRAVLS